MSEIVLETRGITRDYHVGGGLFSKQKTIHALKGIDLKLEKGKTLAIVGESGCGKSTLARIITMIDAPTSGELLIDGQPVDITKAGLTSEMRRKRRLYSSMSSETEPADGHLDALLAVAFKLFCCGSHRIRLLTLLLRVGILMCEAPPTREAI